MNGGLHIVRFAGAGAYVSLTTGGGRFADPVLDVTNWAPAQERAAGRAKRFSMLVGGLPGDHHADIVGFGGACVFVSTHG